MSRFVSRVLSRGFFETNQHFGIRVSRETGSLLSTRRSSSQGLGTTNVRMRIALPADYDHVMDFMSKTYFQTEPSLVNIGLACDEEPPSAIVHLMHQQVKEGMTIIAEDPENCVIGAAINAGSCPWDPEKMIGYAEGCCERGPVRDIIKFYAHVTSEPNLWDRYGALKIYECSHVAVDAAYLGMGIGRRLIRQSWYLARDCGYKLFRIDCTSKYTAKIAEDFGWECVFSLPYRRYIDSGGLVFKCIQEPHTDVRVFVDRPLICKDYCLMNPDGCEIGTAPGGK